MTKILLTKIPILVLLVIPVYNTEEISLSRIKNPILPMKLGNAKLIYSKHTFLHYIELKPIFKQLLNIEKYFNDLKSHITHENITNHISYHGISQNAIIQTQFLIDITQQKLRNLNPHFRNKRGLINIIGKVNKWLFGSLDSEDGDRYNKAIIQLENKQKSAINELNLQISLSKNIIKNYNETIFTLNSNQQKLEQGLRVFKETVDKRITELQDYISLQGIISHINLNCQNLITFLDNIEDGITFARLNTLHNAVIASNELEENINYLKTIYQEKEIPNFKNILTYYQFLGTQVVFSDTRLIFAVHVPIIRSEILSFYHIYPIILNKQTFIPKYPYLAQENNHHQFNEDTCPFLEDAYYCEENFFSQDPCTVQLLSGHFDNCTVIKIQMEESIIEQITKEEILILPIKEETIFSQCQTDQYMKIDNPTLVKIPQNCKVKVNSKTFFNDIRIQRGKPLILPEVSFENIPSLKMYSTPNLTKINFEDIYKLKDMVNQLSPIEDNEEPINTSNIIDIIIIIFISCIIIYFLMKKSRSIKKLNSFCQKKKEAKIEELKPIPENHSLIFSS